MMTFDESTTASTTLPPLDADAAMDDAMEAMDVDAAPHRPPVLPLGSGSVRSSGLPNSSSAGCDPSPVALYTACARS